MCYWKYLKYLIEHKKNVFRLAWDKGLYWHAITHDLSKFRPLAEFIPMAKKFYGKKSSEPLHQDEMESDYQAAVEAHYKRNKHHWNYWTINWEDWIELYEPNRMPMKYVEQMLIDWAAMGLYFGNSAQQYYLQNYHKIKLNTRTRLDVEAMLGLNRFPIQDMFAHLTLEEIIDRCIAAKDNMDKLWFYGDFLGEIERVHNVDVLKLLSKERI